MTFCIEAATLWVKKRNQVKPNQEDFNIYGDELDKNPQTWTFTKAFPFPEQLKLKYI